MPAASRPKCSACRSGYRKEIDSRLIEGDACRKVSEWLKRTHGEAISDVGLAAHKRNHIPVVQDARAKIAAEAQAALDAGVAKIVADVALLDEIASHAMAAVKLLAPAMGRPTMSQAAAFTGALREAREAVRQRDEMLRDRNPPEGAQEQPAVFRVELSYPERPPSGNAP